MKTLNARAQAKLHGFNFYFTGIACKNGHIAKRYVKNHLCQICSKLNNKKLRVTDPKKHYERCIKWQKSNSANYKKYVQKYKHLNKEKLKNYQAFWYSENSQKQKEYNRNWCRENSEKVSTRLAKHRSKKLQASPFYNFNKREIEEVYKTCLNVSKITGVNHEVDHIVPLNHKLVCGLHVPWNLQIITKKQNTKKNNQFNICSLQGYP